MTTPSSLYAHEIAPEVPSGSPLDWHAKYAVARAYGFWLSTVGTDMGRSDRVMKDRILLMLAEAKAALIMYRLVFRDTPEGAVQWAAERGPEDYGEWLHDAGESLGLAMDIIRPYEVSTALTDGPCHCGRLGDCDRCCCVHEAHRRGQRGAHCPACDHPVARVVRGATP